MLHNTNNITKTTACVRKTNCNTKSNLYEENKGTFVQKTKNLGQKATKITRPSASAPHFQELRACPGIYLSSPVRLASSVPVGPTGVIHTVPVEQNRPPTLVLLFEFHLCYSFKLLKILLLIQKNYIHYQHLNFFVKKDYKKIFKLNMKKIFVK